MLFFVAGCHIANQKYNAFMKDVIQKEDCQINSLQDQVIDLSAKLINNEILIHGWDGDVEGEKCMHTVQGQIQGGPGIQVPPDHQK